MIKDEAFLIFLKAIYEMNSLSNMCVKEFFLVFAALQASSVK